MAEQPAVNRQVLGSNPSQGALTKFSAETTLLNRTKEIGFSYGIPQISPKRDS